MSKIKSIPIGKLEIDPANVRPEPDITPEFMENIRDKGVIHNLIVRPLEGDKFGVIVGGRRLVAARNLGLEELPCEVRDIEDDMKAKALSFSENVQRLDIPAWRKRELIRALYDRTDGRKSKENRVKEVMEELNLTRRTVYRYLAIDELPESFEPRLKKPSERSDSEKKQLEEMCLGTSEESPTGEREEEETPSELCEVPIKVMEILARDDHFRKLAEEDPARAHKLATKAAEVGQHRVDREVLGPLKKSEKKKSFKFSSSEDEVVKINLHLGPRLADALERYAETKNWTSHRAVQVIVREFLKEAGFYEEPPIPPEIEGML